MSQEHAELIEKAKVLVEQDDIDTDEALGLIDDLADALARVDRCLYRENRKLDLLSGAVRRFFKHADLVESPGSELRFAITEARAAVRMMEEDGQLPLALKMKVW